MSGRSNMRPWSRLLAALAALAVVLPVTPALAKEPLVAAIIVEDQPRYREIHEAFVKILQNGALGGPKAKVFVQTPNADKMSLANSIRRAVSGGADLIVAYGAPAAQAARKDAGKTPVLFADVADPVAEGIVKSLAAPGVDCTGASSLSSPDRLLQAFLALRPGGRLGALYAAGDTATAQQFGEVQNLAGKGGATVVGKSVRSADEVVPAAEKLLGQVDVLYLADCAAVALKSRDLIALAAEKRVPVIAQGGESVRKGALLILEADPTEQGSLVAVHALQILAGQKAHILPVRTPKKATLSLNAGAARQLGLNLSPAVTALADRTID